MGHSPHLNIQKKFTQANETSAREREREREREYSEEDLSKGYLILSLLLWYFSMRDI